MRFGVNLAQLFKDTPWTPVPGFPQIPTTKVNTDELTFEHPAQENIKKQRKSQYGKLGTALQGYTLKPCARFPPNPTTTKVNTDELTFKNPAQENIKKQRKSQYDLGETWHSSSGIHSEPLYHVSLQSHKNKSQHWRVNISALNLKTSKNKEKHSTVWGKLGTVIQGYTLNPCTKFPPNPTTTKVNTNELTSQHHA